MLADFLFFRPAILSACQSIHRSFTYNGPPTDAAFKDTWAIVNSTGPAYEVVFPWPNFWSMVSTLNVEFVHFATVPLPLDAYETRCSKDMSLMIGFPFSSSFRSIPGKIYSPRSLFVEFWVKRRRLTVSPRAGFVDK